MIVVAANSDGAGVAARGGHASVASGGTAIGADSHTACGSSAVGSTHGTASGDSAIGADGHTARGGSAISALNTVDSGYATIGADASGGGSRIAARPSHRNTGGLATVRTFSGSTIDIKVIAGCSLRAT